MTALILSFFSWPMLIFFAVVIVAAVVIAIAPPPFGPARLLSIAMDSRTWIILAAIGFGISYYHNAQVVQQQQTQIATDQVQSKASDDSAAVVTDNVGKKQKRVVQQQDEQDAINKASDGDKTDALLDVIAKENGQPTVVAPPQQ